MLISCCGAELRFRKVFFCRFGVSTVGRKRVLLLPFFLLGSVVVKRLVGPKIHFLQDFFKHGTAAILGWGDKPFLFFHATTVI